MFYCGITPEMLNISFSLRLVVLNELAVCNVLILLLKSPSEILMSASKTLESLTLIFSFSQINFNLVIWASFAMGENLNLTHLEAKGSIILLI